MTAGQPPQLEYHATGAKTNLSTPWIAWVVIPSVFQLVWYFGWAFSTLDTLEDTSPKQPLRDLALIAGAAIPAAATVVVSVTRGWSTRPGPMRTQLHLPRVVAGLVAALFVLLTICDWVWDDVVNRSVPHGLW